MTTEYEPLSADFLQTHTYLSDQEQQSLAQLRAFLAEKAAPYVNSWWRDSIFPTELLKELSLGGWFRHAYDRTRPFENSALYRGMMALELARVDASLATFFGVHTGLSMGSIMLNGSEAQRNQFIDSMADGEVIGCFALTEPDHGSDVARGLETTARRDGENWVLNGAKRWIGNATIADLAVVWAKDTADDNVKGFLVDTAAEGFSATKIEDKYALRIVQNADILLDNVVVPETSRLQHANSFRDTAKVLQLTRLEVAFTALGNAIGAYEKTVAYTKQREQFGKSLHSFQLVQDLLSRCLANITSSWALAMEVARMSDQGRQEDHHSSMAKLVVANQTREVVAWCRELLGGNGIVLDEGVMRHFVDAEALYSFEGTREMNSLIVGRTITGQQAFV